jgi:hypothetical protein
MFGNAKSAERNSPSGGDGVIVDRPEISGAPAKAQRATMVLASSQV